LNGIEEKTMQRFILTLILVCGWVAPVWAAPPAINTHIMLQKDVLLVGDVFNNISSTYAKHALAPAPAVGQDLVLSASDLERISKTFRLGWQNNNPDVKVTVERDAMLIDHATLINALSESELGHQIDHGTEISISRPVDGITVYGHDMPQLTVTDISYDPLTQNFTAVILASRDRKIINKTTISGMATKMVDMPVLTAPVDRGTVIGKSDLTTVRVPAKSVRFGMVDRIEDVAGMVAKRNIRPNEFVEKTSLMPPVLVRRNEIVTVTYRNGPIVLSTKARALANATRGETVQLENPISKKLIEAVVTGPQQTVVQMSTLDLHG
jgi:flagella basal body P-ring formation protein FlgA